MGGQAQEKVGAAFPAALHKERRVEPRHCAIRVHGAEVTACFAYWAFGNSGSFRKRTFRNGEKRTAARACSAFPEIPEK